MDYLSFEQPIADLALEIEKCETESCDSVESADKIRNMKQSLTDLTRDIYGKLTPWETVQVARHKDRPHTIDYLSLVFDEFVELHGDKLFGDDRAMRVGFASLDRNQSHGSRPPKRENIPRSNRKLFRMRTSGRLSQSDGENEDG